MAKTFVSKTNGLIKTNRLLRFNTLSLGVGQGGERVRTLILIYTGVGPLVDVKVWDQMLTSTNGPMMVN